MTAQTIETLLDIKSIMNAKNLAELNESLAKIKASRRQDNLIRGNGLKIVVDRIIHLAEDCDEKNTLIAAVMMGGTASAARGRKPEVMDRVAELKLKAPPSLDTLSDAEQKENAVKILLHIHEKWVDSYFIQEILSIDLAETARKDLIRGALEREKSLSKLLKSLYSHSASTNSSHPSDSRLKKVKRIFDSLQEVVVQWEGELGNNPGRSLATLFAYHVKGKIEGVEQDDLFAIVDHCLIILKRIIELRFSNALYADTYNMLEEAKRALGYKYWETFLSNSKMIFTIRTNLLEAALVLARQDRTDESLRGIIRICYARSNRYKDAVNKHFAQADDITTDDKKFWIGEKSGSSSQQKEHKIGNSEDEQIAHLLLEIDLARGVMAKVKSDIIPQVENSDPLSASTVKKAEKSFTELSRIVRKLARMRKLSRTNLKGKRVEYNAKYQVLLDGHKPGIRNVVVTRDGVLKKFGNNERTLVKPWVEIEK